MYRSFLVHLIPELIAETKEVRKEIQKEQIFDASAKIYRPLFIQMRQLLYNYQFNENDLFHQTMMSWASLSGFGGYRLSKNTKVIRFDANSFSPKSAQNSFLIPPDWNNYLNRKQNELAIRVMRGSDNNSEEKHANSRYIDGTFDRLEAIKNDYIHFFSPGDEVFDCIVNNALNSTRGRSTAFAAISSLDWIGFVYTYSIEPNVIKLIEAGIPLYAASMYRSYLASSQKIIPIPFASYNEIPNRVFMTEFERIIKNGYFNEADNIEHLGRRGRSNKGFLNIKSRYGASNIEWFKAKYPEENWQKLVLQSSQSARKKAVKEFLNDSHLKEAESQMKQMLSAREAADFYYGSEETDIDSLRNDLEIIYDSLKSPSVRLESAAFVWLKKE